MSGSEASVAGDICEAFVEACWPDRHLRLICCVIITAVVLIAVAVTLTLLYVVAHPVAASVRAAHLSRLALNDTYGLSLAVAVRNPNAALHARHAAPLDAQVTVAGRRFGGAAFRLADAGGELGARETVTYRVEAAGALRADDLPFGKMVAVVVALAGKVTYVPFHHGTEKLAALCSLELQLPPPPGAAQVAKPFHTVKCLHASD